MYIELNKLNYKERINIRDYDYEYVKNILINKFDNNSEGCHIGTYIKLYSSKDKFVEVLLNDSQFDSLIGKNLLEALEISKADDIPWT